MSETSATRTLRTHLVGQGSHVQRFEDKLSSGIPDTMATLLGVPAFLEGKFIKDLPARGKTLIRFGGKNEARLAHQCNWGNAHRKAGGMSFWWVRVRDGGWYLFEDKFEWIRDGVERDIFLAQENLGSAKGIVERLNRHAMQHISKLAS